MADFTFEFEPLQLEIDDDYIEAQLLQLGSRSITTIDTIMRNTPRTGRRYGNHVSSSPGNPPAIDTGRLRQSVGFDAAPREVEVGAGVSYAGYVQDGTSRMAARPFLDVGIDRTVREWPEFMSDFIRAED